MIIEYQIKRIDVVKAYFYNLRYSSRTQLIVFGFAIFIALQILFVRRFSSDSLNVSDYITALVYAIGATLLLPVISFVTAKTQKRSMSIDQQGIETQIGSKKGEIPWTAIAKVTESNDRIVITGKNANAFTIPASAFLNKEKQTEFFNLAKNYLVASDISKNTSP